MAQKLIKIIVIFLSLLIIIAFIAIIYGIYFKIKTNNNIADVFFKDYETNINIYNKDLYIKKTDKIHDVRIINEKLILLIMNNNEFIRYFVIYDFKNDKIIRIIKNL